MTSKNTGLDLESISNIISDNPELVEAFEAYKSGKFAIDADGECYIPEPLDVESFTRQYIESLPAGTLCGIKQPKAHSVYYSLPLELQGNNKGTPDQVRVHDQTRAVVKKTLDKMVENGELLRVHKKTGQPWTGGNPIGMCFKTVQPEPTVELETSEPEELEILEDVFGEEIELDD